MTTIDFNQKINEKITNEVNKYFEEVPPTQFDPDQINWGDTEDSSPIQSQVIEFPKNKFQYIKENIEDIEAQNQRKQRDIANLAAHEEMNDMLSFLDILFQQAERTIMFQNIDKEAVISAIIKPAKAFFFDNKDKLRPEYIDDYLQLYKERIQADINPFDDEDPE